MERRGSGFKKILEDYDFQENAREDLTPKFMAANKDFSFFVDGNDKLCLSLFKLKIFKIRFH